MRAWNVLRLVFKDGNDRCARGGVNAAAAYEVMRPRLFRRSPFFKMDLNHCPGDGSSMSVEQTYFCCTDCDDGIR
ncbi:hypothetical protein C8Q74DRAFT_1241741 [Fomes fomentarius]|nr:hypothetical protein C8Q74DRAFT_1241741 [Fomes fomentarius]